MRERFCPTGTRLATEATATSERLTARVPNLFCRSGHVAAPRRLSARFPPLVLRCSSGPSTAGTGLHPGREDDRRGGQLRRLRWHRTFRRAERLLSRESQAAEFVMKRFVPVWVPITPDKAAVQGRLLSKGSRRPMT